MTTVSIIMPCLNGEKHLAEAIESVLGQSYREWELIIIDNGSSDNSLVIAKSCAEKDSRIKSIECKTPGVSAARNAGIATAQGKYLALLDADDIWYPHKLENEIAVLEANPQYIASYSSVDYINEDSSINEKSFSKFYGYTGEIFLNLLQGNFIQNPSPTLRTEVVKKLGAFDEKLSYGEDWDLFLRLAYKGEFYYHPECNCAYRKHKEQTTQNHNVALREVQAKYLLEKNFKNLSCYLKKFTKLSLPQKAYKLLTRKKESNLKRSFTRAFKHYFSRVSLQDLKNKEKFKKRVLSNLYFRLAKYYKEDGDKCNSKRCIKLAIKLDWRRLLEPVSVKLLLLS